MQKMQKLLVIDDEPGVRFSIQQVFGKDQHTVFAAENGSQGLSLVAQESPEVVLLDLRLGSESGLELLEKIRGMNGHCRVICITGHGTTDTKTEALQRGAFDFLTKPLDLSRLKQVVQRAFEKDPVVQ